MGRRVSTDELEQEEPLSVGEIAPDLNPAAHNARRMGGRTCGGTGSLRRCSSFGTQCNVLALAPTLLNEPVELAQANLFVLEQPAQRMELDRVVLAQHFGCGGELDRIGPPGVVSEAGFDLLDLLAGPEERIRFDAFERPVSFRTAYYVGRSVHRFRSDRRTSHRDSSVLHGCLPFIKLCPSLGTAPRAGGFET